MKHAHARAALILAAAFASGCATRPPAPEKPYLVQLSVAYSDGSCDWSLMQDINNRPMMGGGLGAAYWPHTVPVASSRRAGTAPPLAPRPATHPRARTAPLMAYGTDTQLVWPSQPSEQICLTLYKRASVWQEGVPPALMLEISRGSAAAEIQARTSSSTLASAVVVLRSDRPNPDFPSRRIDLALHDGRAEGRFNLLPDASWVRVFVVATEVGGEGQTERALELLSTAGVEENLIVREGSSLVARPSWPGAGKRSSQPR